MPLVRLVAALLALAVAPLALVRAHEPIVEDEVQKWIAEQTQCEDLDQIHIVKLDEVDFTHNGRAQAIVVAMSCNTGTAGPDIHSVLSRDSEGKLIELEIPPVNERTIEDAPLFGPGNLDLVADNGVLEARYTDSTGRDNPFIIKYKWNGRQFEQVATVKSKPFATSYDCEKATADIDRAVCYVKSLADLARQMSSVYGKLLAGLPAPEKNSLREKQREWLTARNAECPVSDKHFVDCLEAKYQERVAELRQTRSTRKPQ